MSDQLEIQLDSVNHIFGRQRAQVCEYIENRCAGVIDPETIKTITNHFKVVNGVAWDEVRSVLRGHYRVPSNQREVMETEKSP